MRRIDRTLEPHPKSLQGEEVVVARRALVEHYRMPVEVRQRRRPPLNEKIWLSRDVREALTRLFRGKCAFCEQPVEAGFSEGVHHFRPLGNAQGRSKQSQSPDHYGWLAYEWSNLLLTCQECSRSKGSLFPVEGARALLLGTWDEAVEQERALTVDPCSVDPGRYLRFGRKGAAIGKGPVGHSTIETLSLNREGLLSARSSKFDHAVEQLGTMRDRSDVAAEGLSAALADDSPFSGSLELLLIDTFRLAGQTIRMRQPSRANLVADILSIAQRASAADWQAVLRFFESPQLGPSATDLDGPLQDGAAQAPTGYAPDSASRSSARLQSITVEDFKGLNSLRLSFVAGSAEVSGAPCAALLGENSTGKSSLLQAIALCLMGDHLRDRLPVNSLEFLPREPKSWQFSAMRGSRVAVQFDVGPAAVLQIDPDGRMEGETEPSLVLLGYGARRYFGDPKKRISRLSSVRTLFDPLATIPHPRIWLEDLSDSEFAAVARAMRDVLALRADDDIYRGAEGEILVRAHGRTSPFERMSDGYRSLFAMVVDIMRTMIDQWGNLEDARGVVLIDEIETHLHPRWKMKVMSSLRRAMPNVQFIVTTHDPLCLRGMREGEVHVLYRNADEEVEELEGLPDVSKLRAEQLLTSDYFGLASTSDPETDEALERLAISSAPGALLQQRQDRQSTGSPLSLIGDTPGEQIVNEALRRYVEDRRTMPAPDRAALRESAITAVLEGLRKQSAERGNEEG